ncbi:unnamed protein product [Echinostoma caproni]|uniref:Protein FAM13A n=1 Tax=Echinostoma caproni TaxID=27848 RepID=A0A183BE37_9TREM|nr:unnamed protein product [Echinostoma caproni]
MDRLHKLRLPRAHTCCLCCSGAQPIHHLSSDEDEDEVGAVVCGGDTSIRGSQGSDDKLNRAASTLILISDEMELPHLRSEHRILDHGTSHRPHLGKRSTEPSGMNGLGWTISSKLDTWVDEENVQKSDTRREQPACLAPCRSWHRFQRKLSYLFTHSPGPVEKTGVEMGDTQLAEGESEYPGYPHEEDSPMLIQATHTRIEDDMDDGYVLHASSSSLSNVEEYSESELEIRMDNPFWFD